MVVTEDGLTLCANVIVKISGPTKKPSGKQNYCKRENADERKEMVLCTSLASLYIFPPFYSYFQPQSHV